MPLSAALGRSSATDQVVLFSVYDTDNMTVNLPPPDALDSLDSVVSVEGGRVASPDSIENAPTLTGTVPGRYAVSFTAAENLIDGKPFSGNVRSFIIMTGPLGASTARTWLERTGFRIYGT